MKTSERPNVFETQVAKKVQEIRNSLGPLADAYDYLVPQADAHLSVVMQGVQKDWTKPEAGEDYYDFQTRRSLLISSLESLQGYNRLIPIQELNDFCEFVLFFIESRLYEFVQIFTEEEYSALSAHFAHFLTQDTKRRKKFLEYVLDDEGSNLGTNLENYKEIYEDPALSYPILKFLGEMLLKRLDSWGMQAATILTILDSQTAAELLEKPKLPVEEQVSATFTLDHLSWYYCSDAEKYLMQSLEKEKSLLVRNKLGQNLVIIKKVGYLAGIVVKSFVTATGQLVPEGVLITPNTPSVREALKERVEKGDFIIGAEELTGEWQYSRPVKWENFNYTPSQFATKEAAWKHVDVLIYERIHGTTEEVETNKTQLAIQTRVDAIKLFFRNAWQGIAAIFR